MVDTDRFRPRFSERQVLDLAKLHYGLHGSLHPLPSERDQNFRLQTASDRYVVKIHAADERRAVLDLQNRLMSHVATHAPALHCPNLIPTCKAEQMAEAVVDDRTYFVRLLTYLPGTPLANFARRNNALHVALGKFFGELDRALENFQHPAAPTDFYWDLRNAGPTLAKHVSFIDDPDRRRRIERLLEELGSSLQPELDALPRSIIHNDGNDYNILVASTWDATTPNIGVIDFGDVVHSATVIDLAVMAAYVLMGSSDPVLAWVALVRGYEAARPLSHAERRLLPALIRLRLGLSVTLSAYRKTLEPDNAYLTISEKPGWELLERLDALPREFLLRSLQAAAPTQVFLTDASDPSVPAAEPPPPAVAHDWIPELLPCNWQALDLSVESPHLDAAFLLGEQSPAEALGGLTHPGTFARWGERRVISPDFRPARTPELDGEGCTHLGIDLFTSLGAEVRAPTPMIVAQIWQDGLRLRPLGCERGSWILRHLSPSEGLTIGQQVASATPLGAVTRWESWPPHLHVQWLTAEIDAERVPAACRTGHAEAWKSLCPDPSSALGLPPGTSKPLDRYELQRARETYLGSSLSLSYTEPLTFTRGYGCYLVTPEGDSYLDLVNNVCHVGHAHPEVVAAGAQQMKLLNTNSRYLHPLRVRYAERLLATFPAELDTCFLVCSGSEANELALRMARAHSGATRMVAVESGYHGNTQATLDISSYKFAGPGGAGCPEHVHLVPIPDPYHGRHRAPAANLGESYADYVAHEAGAAASRGGLAGFICESIQSCGGQVVLPDGYLQRAYAHVRAQGGVCIADEVQVGFGRAGSAFWAFETQNVVPDIVTLGKPIGNGHPVAAVVTRREIAESFANGMEFFNTFGGNPVSCAVADAVLTILQRDQLQEHARRLGHHFLAQLRELKNKHELIGDVRGLGLFLGVEFVQDRTTRAAAPQAAAYLAERLKEHRILISVDGPRYNVLKIKPPLVIQEHQIARVIDVIDAALAELAS